MNLLQRAILRLHWGVPRDLDPAAEGERGDELVQAERLASKIEKDARTVRAMVRVAREEKDKETESGR